MDTIDWDQFGGGTPFNAHTTTPASGSAAPPSFIDTAPSPVSFRGNEENHGTPGSPTGTAVVGMKVKRGDHRGQGSNFIGGFAARCQKKKERDTMEAAQTSFSTHTRVTPKIADTLFEAVLNSGTPEKWPVAVAALNSIPSFTAESAATAIRYCLLPALLFAPRQYRAWHISDNTAFTSIEQQAWAHMLRMLLGLLRRFPAIFVPRTGSASSVATVTSGGVQHVDHGSSSRGATNGWPATAALKPPRHPDMWSILFEAAADTVDPILSTEDHLTPDIDRQGRHGFQATGRPSVASNSSNDSKGAMMGNTTSEFLERCVPDWRLLNEVVRMCKAVSGRSAGELVLASPCVRLGLVTVWMLGHIVRIAAEQDGFRGNPAKSKLWCQLREVDQRYALLLQDDPTSPLARGPVGAGHQDSQPQTVGKGPSCAVLLLYVVVGFFREKFTRCPPAVGNSTKKTKSGTGAAAALTKVGTQPMKSCLDMMIAAYLELQVLGGSIVLAIEENQLERKRKRY